MSTKLGPVSPERLREMADEVKCCCGIHQELVKGLREIADRYEQACKQLDEEFMAAAKQRRAAK